MSEEFDQEFWESRHRVAHPSGHNQPNPHLVAEAGDLVPGTALDAGCGEGADAIWLATQGWKVTAADIATTALRRAREHAEILSADVTSGIDWVQADLTTWTPTEEHFDLVSSHYVHITGPRDALFRQLAASVAPGGTLLIVGHHPSDQHHASAPEAHVTAEDVAASLDPDRWDVVVAETRQRTAVRPDGHEITMRDAVLRARKRPQPTNGAMPGGD